MMSDTGQSTHVNLHNASFEITDLPLFHNHMDGSNRTVLQFGSTDTAGLVPVQTPRIGLSVLSDCR